MASNPQKPSEHLEVERKFDVIGPTVAPSFEGLSAIARIERSPAQSLDAVYFDTPSHDLAARHITLRRRTGGPDAGWHLKLPAGPDARTEMRAPLGDQPAGDQIPAELRDIMLAIVRDRPLTPVARIATTRTVDMLYSADGTAVAEFCDDEVRAWAADPDGHGLDQDSEQQWREWEIELIEGPDQTSEVDRGLLDRLTNRLLDAGAGIAGHGSKLARVLDSAAPQHPRQAVSDDPVRRAVAENVSELLEWDRAVRSDTYDSVHQLRVTTRKIRSLLQSSGDRFGLPGASGDSMILDELRQLASVLGGARDAEVLAERYQAALENLPVELIRGRVRERLVDGANRRYQAGLRRSLTAMRSPRYFRLLDALEELVAAGPPSAAHDEEEHQTTVDAAYKRVRKAAKAAARAEGDDHDEALHRIRKGAKRLRYTASATGAGDIAAGAKAVQTLLGDHQDSVVSRTHLSQQAAAAFADGEDTFTYGLLYQQEDDVARKSRRELDDALRVLSKAVRKYH